MRDFHSRHQLPNGSHIVAQKRLAQMDTISSIRRSQNMALVRSKNNWSTEQALAAALRRQGIRGWRRHRLVKTSVKGSFTRRAVNRNRLAVRPDFVFCAQKIAVFVDGCFWHQCPIHQTVPKTRRSFWKKKLHGNERRDCRVNRALRLAGWTVLRIWEHAVEKDPTACAKRVERYLQARSSTTDSYRITRHP
jgi:DNA mismatch endonuclease (patch repair protein)